MRPDRDESIASAEFAWLIARRSRAPGGNARLAVHPREFKIPVARISTREGIAGIGLFRGNRQLLESIVGRNLGSLFNSSGVRAEWTDAEWPIWDLLGQTAGLPAFALWASLAGQPVTTSLRVPCYDTSLLIDDLHLTSDDAAVDLIATEASESFAAGHRALKIKVGRGARHMGLEAGTRRDVAIVRAVRRVLGPEAALLIDANNGYNLNLAKRVLDAVADCEVEWIEEPFGEDPALYQDLKEWLLAQSLDVLIADGEYSPSSAAVLEWATQGLIDVVQFDILEHGPTGWLETGRRIGCGGVRTAPHNYGLGIGNYTVCQLAAALPNFAYVEWDEATVEGVAAPGYQIQDGMVVVPDVPGFGLVVDEAVFAKAVATNGFVIRALT